MELLEAIKIVEGTVEECCGSPIGFPDSEEYDKVMQAWKAVKQATEGIE